MMRSVAIALKPLLKIESVWIQIHTSLLFVATQFVTYYHITVL